MNSSTQRFQWSAKIIPVDIMGLVLTPAGAQKEQIQDVFHILTTTAMLEKNLAVQSDATTLQGAERMALHQMLKPSYFRHLPFAPNPVYLRRQRQPELAGLALLRARGRGNALTLSGRDI